MHKKIKFFKNELLNMIKLTQFIKKFNGSFACRNIFSRHLLKLNEVSRPSPSSDYAASEL